MSVFNKSMVCSIALAAAGLASSANAIVLSETYGDVDSYNGQLSSGASYPMLVFPSAAAGDAANTDTVNSGSFSWDTIDLSTYSTINSIQIDFSVYGAFLGSSLQLNGTDVSDITSQSGGLEGAISQYVRVESLSIDTSLFDSLQGELLTLDFLLSDLDDGWSLDYFTVTVDVEEFTDPTIPTVPTTPIPEPFAFSLFGLGLAAMGYSRKRRQA